MTTKAEAVLNWILQSNSLQKKEKQEFIKLVERILKNHGFKRVSKVFEGERKQYRALRFEKLISENRGQWIKFVFEKYGKRCFFVTIGISEISSPNKHLLVGHVIRRKNENQYWWGSKWYSIFRQRAWMKATKKVSQKVPQLALYLDEAKIGEEVHRYIILSSL